MKQIYIHGENSRETKLIEVPENTSKSDVIGQFQKHFPHSPAEEINVFIEDENPEENSNVLHQIANRQHVSCHRCKKIETTVSFNGLEKIFFSPPPLEPKIFLKKQSRNLVLIKIQAVIST